MNRLVLFAVIIMVVACNNSKKEKVTTENKTETKTEIPPATTDYTPTTNLVYSADGTEIKNYASILVSKDKDKLQAGMPYLVVLTSNAAKNNNEYLTVNFLLATKPGSYPVAGSSFMRGKDDNGESYGSILGGKPKLTDYKVTITECKDLGDNGQGGHKWSISGYWDEMVIKAMPIMLTDKSKNHPAEVKIGKGTFTNLSFDDNWDEMIEKAMGK